MLGLPSPTLQITIHRRIFCIAVFFAMRSCEYLFFRRGDRKTLEVIVGDVIFRDEKYNVIPHSNNPTTLRKASTVSLLFRTQKNGIRNATVTQWRSGHPSFCPVLLLADQVAHIRSFCSSNDIPISFLRLHGQKTVLLTGPFMRRQLRSDMILLESWKYGILPSEVGLHTARATCAMSLFINGVPEDRIKYLGRWRSDAFLSYIRDQAIDLHRGLSSALLGDRSQYRYPPTSPTTPNDLFTSNVPSDSLESITFPLYQVPSQE